MFEKAASLGYYAALVTLGDCYMEGKGSSLSFPLHSAAIGIDVLSLSYFISCREGAEQAEGGRIVHTSRGAG
jgi:hypothetical protein